jgi:drug/metabolite transporter (DMT)-like permease
VSRRYLLMLAGLAAIWGASFMFIKVSVRDISPATAVLGRLAVGSLTLGFVAAARSELREGLRAIRAAWWPMTVVGVLNTALPVFLLFWAETRIDSGTAAVLQATAPLFTAVLAFFWVHSERASGERLAGIVVGFGGVGLLVGTFEGGSAVAGLAVVGAALCYAVAGLYAGRRLSHLPALGVAFGTLVISTLVLVAPGVAEVPSEMPGWKSVASVIVLGAVGTGLAYVLYFAIVAGAGASRAILITYLVPPMALFYGAVVLGEELTWSALGGLALILGGVALGSGAVALRRRSAPAAGREVT